jgi:hypothetical protein
MLGPEIKGRFCTYFTVILSCTLQPLMDTLTSRLDTHAYFVMSHFVIIHARVRRNNGKGKLIHITCREGTEEKEKSGSNLSLTTALEDGRGSTSRPGRFTSRTRGHVPMCTEG